MLAHRLPGKEVLPYLNDWDYTWKVICNFSSLSLSDHFHVYSAPCIQIILFSLLPALLPPLLVCEPILRSTTLHPSSGTY